ncbi:MG2 domain-containing protein [Paucibacter sp. APW11]|uniref:MG2 domain-containing protein n=1 Tax=Roseateles aquae TaxID=3077235 RepID=A0ABU3P861_9BURK|nr:MG2 domain-containing protein [Paucibacter sp. APW11]MDT8998766.1 MG2 domain-containing protein [Paucibacter sp. APW11]
MRRIVNVVQAFCLAAAMLPVAAQAFSVTSASPQGQVKRVQQLRLRFSEAMMPLGDARLADPVELRCEGGVAMNGQGRWINEREWVYELNQALPAGASCSYAAKPGFRPSAAANAQWTGQTAFSFTVAAPTVQDSRPWQGSEIEEEQRFLLRLDGPLNTDSLKGRAWCEIQGLGERVPAALLPNDELKRTLKALREGRSDSHWLLLACQRRLPPEARLKLVLGKGIASALNPQVQTGFEQRFEFTVRKPFTAEFSCERERAEAGCLPVRPMSLNFSAPISREQALKLRLRPEKGEAVAPRLPKDEKETQFSRVDFPYPLAEQASFKIELPGDLKDDAGRPLANAKNFPLAVRTDAAPPIAKFAAAPFGVIEREPSGPSLVPITMRHVQPELWPEARRAGTGQLLVKRYASDAEMLQAYADLRRQSHDEWETRKRPYLSQKNGAQALTLPALDGAGPRPFEVIGLPIQTPGYHVLELTSPRLGQSLLDTGKPMYVRTGVLVTNLGVHFKLGRENSLVWVTSLDKGKPVAEAQVVVNDCQGKPLWSGKTDSQGRAWVTQALEPPRWDGKCTAETGLFITARKAEVGGVIDTAFVFSNWNRGIENWRFNVPTERGTERNARAHSVLDRSLLRAGETLSIKHFFRLETAQGLALAPPDQLPTRMKIIHEGSGQEFVQTLQWTGARFAAAQWQIPPAAKLGQYRIELERAADDDRRRRVWASGGFNVEEFRVPLVDARLMAPKGPLIAPEKLEIGAQLNYLAGGAMGNAPVQLSAVLRPRVLSFAGFEGFSFEPPGEANRNADSDEDAEQSAARDSQLVADKLAASTDAQGAARFALAKLPRLSRPSDLLSELSYRDPNGETQTVRQLQPLWPAAAVVGLRSASWVSNGGSIKLQALALDLNGKPLAGQRIAVRARLMQTLSVRKRMVGGFYAYDNRVENQELGELCSGKSDEHGLLNCEVSLKNAGQVDLIAKLSDAQGRSVEAASSVWVTRQGELWFAQDNDDRIDVLPEKTQYEPGETARLQVRMPFREATALVAIEREGIIQTQVQTLSGRDPTLEIKIEKAWAPNVYVSVLAIRGRIVDVPWYSFFSWGWRDPRGWWQAWRASGDYQPPTAMVDLAKPAFKLGVAAIKVGLAQHQLQVKVTPEQAQYGVRQKARVRIQVSQDGKPLANAEAAFAAVDEGLLALRPNASWNLLPAMIQQRAWGVETATAQSEIVGRRHYGRKAVAAGGGGGRATRELFDTLLLWNPRVQLDARGEAVVEVPLNDSLTSFRLVAVADAGAQAFGTGSASIKVSQDLQLLSGLPPLVREGDQFQAMLTLRNASSRALKLKVTLKGELRSDEGSPEAIKREPLQLPPQTIDLAPGAARELSWPVTVPAGAISLGWLAEVSEQGGEAGTLKAGDQLRISQLVQPALPLRVQQSTLQQLDGALSLPVAAPAEALPAEGIKRGGLQLAWQPRLSGGLPGLRRFFETYPYNCLEQQSSKYLGLHDDKAWQALMGKLPSYLDADGLANYFPPRSDQAPGGSDRLTAYLLSAAHEAGQRLPEQAQRQMLDALTAFVDGRLQRRFWSPRADGDVRRLAAIEALSRYGRASARMLATVDTAQLGNWPSAALIDWYLIHKRLADAPAREARLAEVQGLLRSRLSYAGSTLKFSTEDSDAWWWLMDNADGNAGRLILAMLDEPGWKSELPRLVQGALARQNRGAWQTTTANFWGVMAVEKFGARYESQKLSGKSVAQLESASRTLDWARKPEGESQSLPWPAKPATLQLRQEGTGKPWVTLQTLAAVPLAGPMNAGYRINRSLQAVEQKDKSRWSRGDVLRVRLEIEAQTDMSWVVISDPVPGGASVLGGGVGGGQLAAEGERREGDGWLAYEERSFEAWRGYYAYLPRGKQLIEYTVRLNNAGRFQLPGTRVEAMYAPDRFGELPGGVLEVAP